MKSTYHFKLCRCWFPQVTIRIIKLFAYQSLAQLEFSNFSAIVHRSYNSQCSLCKNFVPSVVTLRQAQDDKPQRAQRNTTQSTRRNCPCAAFAILHQQHKQNGRLRLRPAYGVTSVGQACTASRG